MKNIKYSFSYISLVALLLVFGCQSCESDTNGATKPLPAPITAPIAPAKLYKVPPFDAQNAYDFIQKQVDFGFRVPNQPGHKKTKTWLVSKFKEFGWNVIEQDFVATAYNGTKLNSTNIIAQYNPTAAKRILLGAHWDTRHVADKDENTEEHNNPIAGADDGGSGVGVLLEIARVINKNPIDVGHLGIDIILFDAEDHGQIEGTSGGTMSDVRYWCMGSQYWAKNQHVANYRPRYGILLDMVGSEGARFTKEGMSFDKLPQQVNKVWRLAKQMNKGKYFVDEVTGPITDDHTFVMLDAGIPMMDIINNPEGEEVFGHYHHTQKDNMDIISKETLQAVGQVVTAVLYKEASGGF